MVRPDLLQLVCVCVEPEHLAVLAALHPPAAHLMLELAVREAAVAGGGGGRGGGRRRGRGHVCGPRLAVQHAWATGVNSGPKLIMGVKN